MPTDAEQRLKTADYYRTVLENERTSREQADKQILNLLYDVRNRYESKLGIHMAKKNKSNAGNAKSKPIEDSGGWGTTENTDKPAEESGWGTTEAEDKPDDGWGTTETKDNTDEGGGWGTNETENKGDDGGGWSTNDNDIKPADDDWDTAEVEDKSKDTGGWGASSSKDKSKDSGSWGTSESKNKTKDSGGWGNSESNDKTKESSSQSTPGNKNKPKENSSSKTTESNDKRDNSGSGSKGSKPDQGKNKGKQAKDKLDKGGDRATTETKDKSENSVGSDDSSKLKSLLLTAKLDMRLLEREKSNLTEETTALRSERDQLVHKLGQVNQENDTLKVKVRGLTVDLVSANDEIHKLNERLDEMEAERRNRDRDNNLYENRRKSMENKYKSYQQQIANLQSEAALVKDEREDYARRCDELSRRTERLEHDLNHSKNLIAALKDGCSLVESQAKTFEIRHDTVVMSKSDLERELIAIKEESSRHITTINSLQKSNEQISKAFVLSVEAHEKCKKEFEVIHQEYTRKLENYKTENMRLVEANGQLRKLVDYLQNKCQIAMQR